MSTPQGFLNPDHSTQTWQPETTAARRTTEVVEDTVQSAGTVILFPGGLSLVPPHARVTPEVELRFRQLSDEWIGETGFLSDPVKKFMHRSHLKIIGMGEKALPLILREVERMSGHWFVALDSISPVNPVRPEDEADVRKTAKAWLDWGRNEGLIS